MDGPKVPPSVFTERTGVLHFAAIVNRAGCLWRETVMHDVGIDGQVEYVTPDGTASGRTVLVQIKSGKSYFEGQGGEKFRYRPSPSHRSYWERVSLPVILILYDPSESQAYWADARAQIRSGHEVIEVSLTHVVDEAAVISALSSEGPLPGQEEPLTHLIGLMIASRCPDASLPLDYFDLFVHGLVELCLAILVGMDVVTDLARATLELNSSVFGMGLGSEAYQFLSDFHRFLITQDLARVDYDHVQRFEQEMQLVPTYLAPLTARGRALVKLISSHDLSEGVRVIQDKATQGIMEFEYYRRVPVVLDFKRKWLSAAELTSNARQES